MTSAVEQAAAILGPRARRDVPLGPLTTYRVGGAAALFLTAAGEDDLALARQAVVATGLPVLVVGRGSNLLVADGGFAGLAVTLGEAFAGIEVDGGLVRAGGAVSLPVLARRTAQAGLTGLEWAVGVPGSVGGAVRMNAGGHGSETRDTLTRARLVDLAGPGVEGSDSAAGVVRRTRVPAAREVDVAALDLGYRHSAVRPEQVVVEATFSLRPGDPDASLAEIAGIVRWRREHQPGGANAGSVFTNPPGDSAGRLVDAAGLKGLRVGSATVSPKHANFFQADEGGSADDVRALVIEVRRQVEERMGVRLEPELRMVGFDQDQT